MTAKPRYQISKRDVPVRRIMPESAASQVMLQTQKVFGADTSILFAEREPDYHTRPHRHDCEQFNYIVSGEIWFYVDGHGYHCKAGDIMRIPRNKVHWAWNRGTETAVLIEAHAPPLIGRRAGGEAVGLLGPEERRADIKEAWNEVVDMDPSEIARIEALPA